MREYKQNAFDTETVGGFARIVATKQKYWLVHSFEDVMKPLIMQSTNYGSAFFCWNLNYDVRAIIKYLPLENLIELAKTNETIYEDFKLFYIESKLFTVKYTAFETDRSISFYDITQFYNYQSLDSMAEKYLGSNKINNPITNNIKSHQDNWSPEILEKYFKDNYNKIGEYCQKDASLTAQLAGLMADKIKTIFGINLRRWSSKAAIAEKLSYKKGFYPENFGEGSKHYNYAQLAFRGGMFDSWQRGRFEDGITEIDISSAYPAVQTGQPHWGNGTFYDISNEKEILIDDYYGWFLVTFDCPYIPYDSEQTEAWKEYHENKRTPENPEGMVEIIVPDRKKVFYPTGFRAQILTLHELNFLKKYGYNYEIEDGFVWRQNKNEFKAPFTWIEAAYGKKAEYKTKYGKDSIEYALIKIAINGCYGKTVQKIGAHVMQDFRYGSYITAETRVKLISFILDHKLEDKVILIATDGIYLDGIHQFDDLGTGLGSWDCEYFDNGIFLGNGLYQLFGEHSKLKLRGYGSGRYNFKDYNPFTYDLLHDIQKHPNETEFASSHKAMRKRKPNTFRMCLNLIDYTKDDINKFMFREKLLSAFSDKTKHWPGINSFGDLLSGKHRGIRFTVDEIEEE